MILSGRIYIIAEAGVNHNGSIDLAKKLIDAAADADADAVKFQTFKTETLVSTTAPKAEYQKATTGVAESQFEMLRKLELDQAAHNVLVDYCGSRGIQFLSTAFDEESLKLLDERVNVPRIKISSGEITNAPLLLAAARTGKPIILSTGMSSLDEVEQALGILAFGYGGKEEPSIPAFKHAFASVAGRGVLEKQVVLLHCTTEYPAPLEDVNLQAMDTLRQQFGLAVGFSDHTVGINIAVAAAARGACIIEKHVTIDRTLPGPDHQASLEPHELKAMVRAIRDLEKALGSGEKRAAPGELKNRAMARRSIVAAQNINKGDRFSPENLAVKRPGTGLSPVHYWEVLGKEADKFYHKDEMISL